MRTKGIQAPLRQARRTPKTSWTLKTRRIPKASWMLKARRTLEYKWLPEAP